MSESFPGFDAQAYYNSLKPPMFKDPTGKVHVGRIIGADTWFKFQTRLRSPIRADGSVDHAALQTSMRTMVNSFFPRPWYKPWQKSVAYWLWKMPMRGRMLAIYDFMQAQASIMSTSLPPLPGRFLTNTPEPAVVLPAPQTSGPSPSSTSDSQVSITSGAEAGSGEASSVAPA